jgi:hypothetical protein
VEKGNGKELWNGMNQEVKGKDIEMLIYEMKCKT